MRLSPLLLVLAAVAPAIAFTLAPPARATNIKNGQASPLVKGNQAAPALFSSNTDETPPKAQPNNAINVSGGAAEASNSGLGEVKIPTHHTNNNKCALSLTHTRAQPHPRFTPQFPTLSSGNLSPFSLLEYVPNAHAHTWLRRGGGPADPTSGLVLHALVPLQHRL